jgi:hypothetical protein
MLATGMAMTARIRGNHWQKALAKPLIPTFSPHTGRRGANRERGKGFALYFPISDLALSGVIAVVGTVTVAGTLSAQSSKIDFAMSIA